MFPHLQLNEAEDLFTRLEGRVPQGVYFYRIIGYSSEIEKLLARYDVLKNKVSGKKQTILSSFHIASEKTKGKFIIIFDIVSNEVLYDFVPAVFHKKDMAGVIDTLVLCSVIVTNLNTGKSLTI